MEISRRAFVSGLFASLIYAKLAPAVRFVGPQPRTLRLIPHNTQTMFNPNGFGWLHRGLILCPDVEVCPGIGATSYWAFVTEDEDPVAKLPDIRSIVEEHFRTRITQGPVTFTWDVPITLKENLRTQPMST